MNFPKKCKNCNELKEESCFFKCVRRTRGNIIEYSSICKNCEKQKRIKNKKQKSEYDKKYYQNNITEKKKKSKDYRLKNYNKIKEHKRKKYYDNNIEINKKNREKYLTDKTYRKNRLAYEKLRYLKNKDKIKKNASEWQKNNKEKINHKISMRRKNDPNFKIRHLISCSIRKYIKLNKSRNSILKYLQYSIQDLKSHLEKQFETWMNWGNHGKYDPNTWDDNNSLTWTWQIDHIVPHATFQYTSMNDDDFKKCWALNNLRPYSAKQNILDGASRKRH